MDTVVTNRPAVIHKSSEEKETESMFTDRKAGVMLEKGIPRLPLLCRGDGRGVRAGGLREDAGQGTGLI